MEKKRIRALEDMYDYMLQVITSDKMHLVRKDITEWEEHRKKLRAELKELEND